MAAMHLLLLYDISDDRIRTKVACACEDYGLDRIQYSAFYGRLNRNLQGELMLKVTNLLGDSAGCIQLVPVAADDWERRMEVNNSCSTILTP
jgi:CRISPR-associated protein Cas2